MNKFRILLFTLACSVTLSVAQSDTVRVAILETAGNGGSADQKAHITSFVKDEAIRKFPNKNTFIIVDKDSIAARMAQDSATGTCNNECLAKLCKDLPTDFIAQGSLTQNNKKVFKYSLNLYECENSSQRSVPPIESKNFSGLDKKIKREASRLFDKMINSSWVGVEYLTNQEANGKLVQRKIINLTSSPAGAKISIDGKILANCITPCQAQIEEGNHTIKWMLDRYENFYEDVDVNKNDQTANANLKPRFGLLVIDQKFDANIGEPKDLSVYLDGEKQEKYDTIKVDNIEDMHIVTLKHPCYDSIDAKVRFRDGGDIQTISAPLTKALGVLNLSVKDKSTSKFISVPVFVNGKKTGETPFNAQVPICAAITIGPLQEPVNTPELMSKPEVTKEVYYEPTYPYFDPRDDSAYTLLEAGNNIWLAEDMRYKTDSAKCTGYYFDYPSYTKYCYYNKEDSKQACPAGFHIMTQDEWKNLQDSKNQEVQNYPVGYYKFRNVEADPDCEQDTYTEKVLTGESTASAYWIKSDSAKVIFRDSTGTYVPRLVQQEDMFPVHCVKD